MYTMYSFLNSYVTTCLLIARIVYLAGSIPAFWFEFDTQSELMLELRTALEQRGVGGVSGLLGRRFKWQV